MNKELLKVYEKLKTNFIQSPIAFDLLNEIISHPECAELKEKIAFDKERMLKPDGDEITNAVLEAVCNACKISSEELFCRLRLREFNDARIIYTMFLRKGTNWSYAKMASHLNRHHATMLHNMKTFESLVATNPPFKKKVLQIIHELNNKKIFIFDDILTNNKWKYERTNGNLERSAIIARKTRQAIINKRREELALHTSNA
jgi:hypothetical protein